jgi:hypothetical protein
VKFLQVEENYSFYKTQINKLFYAFDNNFTWLYKQYKYCVFYFLFVNFLPDYMYKIIFVTEFVQKSRNCDLKQTNTIIMTLLKLYIKNKTST